MPFVLDISVVAGWYLPDQATAYTQSIAKRMETDRAIAPALWRLEFANVLKTACTRGKLSLENAREIVLAIAALPIELDSGLAPGPRQLLNLAVRYRLSSYDAAYLELAMRHGIPISCQDAKLKEASLQAHVVVL